MNEAMTAQLEAAEYAVQKWKRLNRARENAERSHVTQSELDVARMAARNAEIFFQCAVEDLCQEFPEIADDV